MSREIRNTVIQPPKESGPKGGFLRELIRPFYPQVAAGIDVASGLMHGNGDEMSKGLASASQALGSEEEGPVDGEGEEAPGEVTPGELLAVNPVGGDEPEAIDNPEEEASEEDLTPEQMASLQQIDQQFPGINQELAADPLLLDGVGNMVNKLRYMYRKQAQGGVQA